MEIFATPEAWISLLSLAALEIVLGIDNIVFISILAGKLPKHQQAKGRQVGLIGALVTRLLLLLAISWIMGLEKELFVVFDHGFSGRHLILLAGGLFLLFKATKEIFDKLEVSDEKGNEVKVASLTGVIIQIMLIDIVFSLDSVITAVGMVEQISIMVIAMVSAVIVMMVFSGRISRFIEAHPSMKILALSFLLLVGVLLVAESFDQHINKGYVYFAMAFSLFVEVINIRTRKAKRKPVPLHNQYR